MRMKIYTSIEYHHPEHEHRVKTAIDHLHTTLDRIGITYHTKVEAETTHTNKEKSA